MTGFIVEINRRTPKPRLHSRTVFLDTYGTHVTILQYMYQCCRHVTLVTSLSTGSHVATRKLQFAEEGPTLWVESYKLSKTFRWYEHLINSIMNLSQPSKLPFWLKHEYGQHVLACFHNLEKVASRGYVTYEIAKLLAHILSPLVHQNLHCLKNSAELVEVLSSRSVGGGWHHGFLWRHGPVHECSGGPKPGSDAWPPTSGWHLILQDESFSGTRDQATQALFAVDLLHVRWPDLLAGGGSSNGVSSEPHSCKYIYAMVRGDCLGDLPLWDFSLNMSTTP